MMGCLQSKPPPPDKISMKAALLIQRWYRRYLARMEVRRRYTWNIFQNLEYAGEQDQVELYNFFNALLTHIPVDQQRPSQSNISSRASTPAHTDERFMDESEDESSKTPMDGPIEFPLTKKDVNVLIDLFRKKSYHLHAKYVGKILREATSRLKRCSNFNVASTAISKQVTIIGDLHGKLDDLLVVFHKNGLPSAENPYVFNGDFVDRGKKGLEVLLLLLSCFLAFPGAVFLNRGNHEDSVMNARYGFIKEVQSKYKKNSEKILLLIDEVYRWLPLGTIINNRVLVVHGGISDATNLDLIKSLDRGKYVSILRPPIGEFGDDQIDKLEWKQMFDIMWSDPQLRDGCEPNSTRGAGSYFGPDVTEKFLKKNKLIYLIRSHECKPEGYEFMHNDKVITIFSASNYYAIGSNKGAYLKLNPHLDPYFVQYISAASKTRRMTFHQRVGLVESSAIRGLGARLRDKREELEQEFLKRDPNQTGVITITQWCDSMENATKLGLPWRMLRDKLAPMSEEKTSNDINYLTTLELLDTDTIVEAHEAETSVAESLYRNKSSLEAIFHILDKDNSGQISLDEFGDAIDLLKNHMTGTTTREQLLDMCKLMDINKDGFVDLNEFLEAFRLVDHVRKTTFSRLSSTPSRLITRSPTNRQAQRVQKVAAAIDKSKYIKGEGQPKKKDDFLSKTVQKSGK